MVLPGVWAFDKQNGLEGGAVAAAPKQTSFVIEMAGDDCPVAYQSEQFDLTDMRLCGLRFNRAFAREMMGINEEELCARSSLPPSLPSLLPSTPLYPPSLLYISAHHLGRKIRFPTPEPTLSSCCENAGELQHLRCSPPRCSPRLAAKDTSLPMPQLEYICVMLDIIL